MSFGEFIGFISVISLVFCLLMASRALFRETQGKREEPKIVHFRCSACDHLMRSPPTPFNQGSRPLCAWCAERNFPNEFKSYRDSNHDHS
jgi:hypothetical protein